MKKNLIFQRVLACLAALLVSVFAKAGECTIDGIKYYYEYTLEQDAHSYHLNALVKVIDGKEKEGVVTIPAYIPVEDDLRLLVTVIGANAFEGNTKITRVIFSGGISHIYGSAFKNCTALEDVTVGTPSEGMPSDGLTYIEDNAFENCTSLRSIDLPNSLLRIGNIGGYSFAGCTSLTSIVLPENLRSIARSSFRGCINLKTVTVNSSLTTIGDNAFNNCDALTDIDLSKGIGTIGEYAFYSCNNMKSIKFPSDGFSEIGTSCFQDCTSLESITIPGSVKTIGNYFCRGCTGLKNAVIELGSNRWVGNNYFLDCTGLTQATISWYEELPSSLFKGCINLKTVVLNNTKAISSSVFEGCAALESVSIPQTVKTIGLYAFKNCSVIENINIPSSVTTINGEAFMGCSSLKNIAIPEGVTKLPNSVFEGCSSLESISLPSSITEIGNKSLWGCSSLTKLDLPSHLQIVKNSAFVNCKRITSFIFPATLTTLEPNAFYGCKGLRLIDLRLAQVKITNTSRDSNNSSLVFRDVPESTLILMPGETFTISDPEVLRICLENWDSDKDGELSAEECMAVTDLGDAFRSNSKIENFCELQYFTGLTSIGNSAFSLCSKLSNIVLPETVEIIEDAAFWGCKKLTEIIIPAKVRNIGLSALSGCPNRAVLKVEADNSTYDSRNECNAIIETATNKLLFGCATTIIPDEIVSIRSSAFHQCKGLKSIVIGKNVIDIEEGAFLDCEDIESITVDRENPVYDSRNGCNAIIRMQSNELLVGCRNTVIPNEIVTICPQAFRCQYALTNIHIPENVKKLDWQAFNNSGLVKIELPEGLTILERNAFTSCTELTRIELPSTLTTIGYGAFDACSKVSTMIVKNNIPLSVSSNTLPSNRSEATLYVPIGCKADYEKADYWNEFKIIQEFHEEASGIFVKEDNNVATLTDGNDLTEKEFVIPQSITVDGEDYAVTAIGENAFANNLVMKQVTIPESVTAIGDGAFAGCTGLEAIYCFAKNPIKLGCATVLVRTRAEGGETVASNVFAEVNKGTCVLYVPSGCKKKYAEASGWNEFQTIKEFGGTAVMCGDANSDGKINVADIVEIVNNGKGNPSENFNEANADVNADGSVDKDDLELITNYLMNLAPKTLYELKAMINMGIVYNIYEGYYVDGSGNISASDVNAVGRICYISNIDVDEAVPGSRILVLDNTDITAPKGVTWGVYGEFMHLNDTKTLCGYSNTLTLQAYGHRRDIRIAGGTEVGYETGFPAACYAWNYDGEKPIGASHWFLPSYAQWNLISTIARTSGTGQLKSGMSYWTSTDNSASLAYHYSLSGRGDNPKDYFIYNGDNNKDWSQFCVRACYAY